MKEREMKAKEEVIDNRTREVTLRNKSLTLRQKDIENKQIEETLKREEELAKKIGEINKLYLPYPDKAEYLQAIKVQKDIEILNQHIKSKRRVVNFRIGQLTTGIVEVSEAFKDKEVPECIMQNYIEQDELAITQMELDLVMLEKDKKIIELRNDIKR